MQLSDAVAVIAEHHGLKARELELLLEAVTRTDRGRIAWSSLARFSNNNESVKVSLHFHLGDITHGMELTATVEAFSSLVKVGEAQ